MENLFEWTGHPFVDVGVAGLCAMVGKQGPEELTAEDVDRAAEELAEYYFDKALLAYLSCVFPNAEYVQPEPKNENARRKKAKKREEYKERVLFAHRNRPQPEAEGLTCAFCGKAASQLVHRSQVPMISGDNVINFYPEGLTRLPICGYCLVAIQVLPMAGRRVQGRLLIAHSDEAAMTLAFARQCVEENRRIINLYRSQEASDKYPGIDTRRTFVLWELTKTYQELREHLPESKPFSITVYWMSNSGQGPGVEIFHLPSNLLKFLLFAGQAPHGDSWRRLLAQHWMAKSKQKNGEDATRHLREQNRVVEDLVNIFEGTAIDKGKASHFVRQYLRPHRHDPYWWNVVELFLREVLAMDADRIDAIRNFADGITDYICRANDRNLAKQLLLAENYSDFRRVLVRAQRRAAENGELLFGFDDFVTVFDLVGGASWEERSLTMDLIAIRMTEKLVEHGFLTKEELEVSETA